MRYPKGPARQVPPDEVGSGLSARLVRRGPDVCILAVGKLVEAAEEAARLLHLQGIGCTVWDVRLVKPLDPHMIADAAGAPLVVTAEDGIRVGGAGIGHGRRHRPGRRRRGDARRPRVMVLGVPDEYLAQGPPARIHAALGLDGPGIAASVLGALEAAPSVHPLS